MECLKENSIKNVFARIFLEWRMEDVSEREIMFYDKDRQEESGAGICELCGKL